MPRHDTTILGICDVVVTSYDDLALLATGGLRTDIIGGVLSRRYDLVEYK